MKNEGGTGFDLRGEGRGGLFVLEFNGFVQSLFGVPTFSKGIVNMVIC